MKKIFLSLFLILLVLSLSGCKVEFTALTKINPDGSGFRITTYSAEDESEKEELLTRYDLPEGGSWKTEEYKQKTPYGPSKKHIYEVKRAFKDLNKLAPDCVRKGMRPGNISSNAIALKIQRGILFTTYEYEERFKDSTNEGRVREFCEKYFDDTLDIASKNIAASLPKYVKKDEVAAFLDEKYRPEFDYFITIFSKNGYKPFSEENSELKKKWDAFEGKIDEKNFYSEVADYIVEQNKNVDKEEIQNKLKETHEKISEEMSTYAGELAKNNYDDALGVYGWPLFVSYPFQVTVIMPGKIINANTKEVKTNNAKWIFSREDFFLKECKLEAKSRRLNFVSAAIMAVGLFAVLIIATLKGMKNHENK